MKRYLYLIACLFCLSVFTNHACAQVITTICGGNTQGAYTGDGGPADSAQLSSPMDVCFDRAGNLYIADQGNNCIRKIDRATGVITTVAGNGQYGYTGDGGLADTATLYNPIGVAVDTQGNIFIADFTNNVVREVVDSSGIIITFAGTDSTGYNGDGIPANLAQLSMPSAVALDDSGNLYIADAGNSVVRKVSAATHIITTFAGTDTVRGYAGDNGPADSALLDEPQGLWIDIANNVFIADGNSTVRKVNGTTGIITTVAGNGINADTGDNGPAVDAELGNPDGVATDAAGNIYISDGYYDVIRKVNNQTGIITTFAGTELDPTVLYGGDGGPPDSAALNGPAGLCFDTAGNLYIADNLNDAIRKITFSAVSAIKAPPVLAFKVYPNPSKGQFVLQLSGLQNEPVLEVYNLMGDRIGQATLCNTVSTIDLSGNADGVYFFRLISGQNTGVQKVVLAR